MNRSRDNILISPLIKLYRFCIQANYETYRNYTTVLRLLQNVTEAATLLDIGCVDGKRTMEYAKTLSIPLNRVYGIEISPKYIAQAQKLFKIFPVDLEKDTLPFQDQEIDIIVCNQILEHLKNIFLTLSEMDRVLKVGGHLIIGIPNLASLLNRIFILFGRQPMCNEIMGPHIRCFTHRGFLKFVKLNANFELISIDAASLYPLPYPLLQYCAKYLPGLSSYTLYLLKKIKHNPANCGWTIKLDIDTFF